MKTAMKSFKWKLATHCPRCLVPLTDGQDFFRIEGYCPTCWRAMTIAERLVAARDDWRAWSVHHGTSITWAEVAAEIWAGWEPVR